MDESMRQTFSTFDFLHCGKHNNVDWDYLKILICWWLGRLKINIGLNLVHFWNSHVRADKLDVQETNFTFTQLYRSGNNFS